MIRFQIAILFSTLTGLALIFFMSLVFFNTQKSIEENFYEDLIGKARLGAQYVLEEDELAADIYDEIINKHMVKLPDEKQYVIELKDTTEAIQKGLMSHETAQQTLRSGAQKFARNDRYFATLFYPDNEGDFIILVSAINQKGEKQLNDLINNMITGLIITMIAQFIVGLAFAKTITFPIHQISSQLDKINTSDLSSRIAPRKRKDELGKLIATMNSLLDRLEYGFNIQREFISNASHELKTPLTIIRGESETTLNKERDAATYQNALKTIHQESEKLSGIMRDLIHLTEVSSGKLQFEKQPFGVEEMILEIQAQMFQYCGNKNLVTVHHHDIDAHSGLQLVGNKNWVMLALTNLLKNAVKYSGFEKEVSITLQPGGLNGQQQNIHINIADQGIGIPKDDLHAVKSPFFRGSNTAGVKGNGIGLSIADHIIKLHDGKIDITSEVGKGTKIKVTLPLA